MWILFEEFTAYENIQNLKAGHYYEIDISTLDIEEKQYFDLKRFLY